MCDSSLESSSVEKALQGMCKQVLKGRFFRGHYAARRYVEPLNTYRDFVVVHHGERELEKILLDIKSRFSLFYRNKPDMWIGISTDEMVCGLLTGFRTPAWAVSTCIWTELSEVAFGPYWFSIKSVRFRENEMVVKLKMVRPDTPDSIQVRKTRSEIIHSQPAAMDIAGKQKSLTSLTEENIAGQKSVEHQIDLQDFVDIVRQWGISIKHTVYDFMSKDVTKENICEFLRFFGLLIVALLTGVYAAVRFLGVFTLRLMFEFSRLAHTLTPLALKTLELINKIIGGFYILLAMIWRDSVGHRLNPRDNANNYSPALPYNRPMYKSIEYNVRQHRAHLKQQSENDEQFD